jgi:hypothetical protein
MTAGLAPAPLRPTPTHRRRGRRHRRPGLLPIAVIVVCFVASRIGFWLAGVRFDMTPLTVGSEQLLAARLLRGGQLLTSVWHLQSQPPLFNLYCGIILHLPRSLQSTAAWVSFMAIGLVMVMATYLLLLELRASPSLALVVALIMIVSPTGILYENWLFYAYPSAAALALGGLFCARYLRTNRWPYGLGFFSCVCGLALTDSLFQPIWVLAVLILMAVIVRRHLRELVAVAAIPVLLMVGWVAKDAVLFGTYTTSSWTGMNLAQLTLVPAARTTQLKDLVRQGTLTPLALVGPWKQVSAYVPKYVAEPRTGVAALDDRFGQPGRANYNNIAYARVSSLLLADDLRYIAHEPGDYLHYVSIGAGVWLTPADQYPFVYQNWLAIRPWADGFDVVIGWQPEQAPAATTAFGAIDGHAPPASHISYSTVVVYAVALVGTPLFLWLRRRRLDRKTVGLLVFLWGTTAYAYASASLLDIAENNRLRFELGPTPLVLAVAVCLWSVEPWLSPTFRAGRWWRWFGLSGQPPGPAGLPAESIDEDGVQVGSAEDSAHRE